MTVQLQPHTAVVSTTANTTTNTCTTINRGIQPVATESPPPKSIFQKRRRNRLTSPASSPHKLGKVGPKRRRTVAVQKLFTKNTQTPEHTQEARRNANYQLSLDTFKESEHEKCEREGVQSKLFSYNTQKYVAQEFTDKMVLNDVQQFLNVDNEDENCQTSKIYYMELVDEHPDSDETMLEVAEDLLDKFTTETQQGWVVLVGDGKTYEHLMNIKRHYGQALQKLLIFPGDWHTLKNFQPVLMKIYYSAGLKELAMASGYRGSTLSSLENCSNFKRTHCFLLQVWEALYREMFQSYAKHSQSTASVMLDTTKCILSTAIQENLEPEELMKRVERLMPSSGGGAWRWRRQNTSACANAIRNHIHVCRLTITISPKMCKCRWPPQTAETIPPARKRMGQILR